MDDQQTPARRLAVLGSPISHSQSPALHRAAYTQLGLDWVYDAIEVDEASLPDFVASLGPEWLGLSLTMPLKQAVLPLLDDIDQVASVSGAANTIRLGSQAVVDETAQRRISGFNTDVGGIVRALAAAGLTSARFVHIVGGGATAASAIVAAAELGAERVLLSVRSVERSAWLEPLARSLGLVITFRPLSIADRSLDVPELVVSTLPGTASVDLLFTDSTRRRAVLLDVSYDPWPSALARSWGLVGGTVVSGLEMLAHQALLQVRVFVNGDPLEPLPDEESVLAAMLEAVGLVESAAVPES